MLLFPFLFYQELYHCPHDELYSGMRAESMHNPPYKVSLSDEKKPFRVLFDFNTIEKDIDKNQCRSIGEVKNNGFGSARCDPEDIITPEKLKILKGTFQNISSYVSSLIKVSPYPYPIRIKSSYSYPTDGRTVNDADLVVTVFLRPYGDGNILASAIDIYYDEQTGRPIQGVININLKKVPNEGTGIKSERRFFFETALHELMHVLGFSSNAFYRWLDPRTGKRYTKSVYVNTELPEYPGKNFRILTTPNSVKVAQRRFGREFFTKDIPMGLEIETLGGSGTSGSHLKGRSYYNEIMAGIAVSPAIISEATLAVLEDTGWYQCDWSLAEPLAWGSGESMGLPSMYDFPSNPPDLFPEHYLCNPEDDEKRVCNYDFSGIAICGAPNYLDKCPTNNGELREICNAPNFYDKNGTHWFGPSDCHDFMRILKARDPFLCRAPIDDLKVVSKNNFMTFGKESMCSPIVGRNENGTISRDAGCYNMECADDGESFVIETTKGNVTCTKKNQRIPVEHVSIICPDPHLICPMKKFLNMKTQKPDLEPSPPTPSTSTSSASKTSTSASSKTSTIEPTSKTETNTEKVESQTNNDSQSEGEEGENRDSISKYLIAIIISSVVCFVIIITLIVYIIRRNSSNDANIVLNGQPEENTDAVMLIASP